MLPGCETFEDLIYGNIAYDVALNEGDPVIIKSDGFPTYHFANVVDDHFMKITHVLRGAEWQISTTKHILLYRYSFFFILNDFLILFLLSSNNRIFNFSRAFNWEPPTYGHLPLLINSDGTKLSKRQGDINISHYQKSGIFPLALVNYITSTGGGFEKDSGRGLKPKIYTIEELTSQFDINKINSHPGRLMSERLFEFNRLELQRKLENENEMKKLIEAVKILVKDRFLEVSEEGFDLRDEHVKSVLKWSANRINKLEDLISNSYSFLWVLPVVKRKSEFSLEEWEILKKFKDSFKIKNFENRDEISGFLRNFAKEKKFHFSKFMKILRIVLSGLKEGPSVAEMIEILGKKDTVGRIEAFMKK